MGRPERVGVHGVNRADAERGAGRLDLLDPSAQLPATRGIAFNHRGEASLKGIPGTWQLFAVDEATAS